MKVTKTTRRVPLRRYHVIRDRKRNDYQVVRAGRKTFTSYGFFPTIEDATAALIVAEHKPQVIEKAYRMVQPTTLPFPIPTAADLMDGPSDSAVAHGWNNGKAPR